MNFDNFPTLSIPAGTTLSSKIPHKQEAIFLCEGYAVEYLSISAPRKVISFIGPQEFIFRTEPKSIIIALTDVTLLGMLKPKLKSLLHECEEARQLYRIFKKIHLEKIAKNRNELRTFTPAKRYISLLEKYPWVKDIASQDDIHSYINISSIN